MANLAFFRCRRLFETSTLLFMQEFHEEESSLLFNASRSPVPPPRWKRPKIAWEGSEPVCVLTDAMGNDHRIADGSVITNARFEGWDLSGILWVGVTLENVSFASCRLANWELQHCSVRRTLLEGCVGGLVWKDSSIDDVLIERVHDDRAVQRFFRCSIETLTLSNLECGLEIARCEAEDIQIQASHFKGIAAIQSSAINGLRLLRTSLDDLQLHNTKLIASQFSEVSFTKGQFRECDLSFSHIVDVDFERVTIKGLRLDWANLVSVNFRNGRADDVTSAHSEWVAVQLEKSGFDVQYQDCFLQSVMWHKIFARIVLIRTRGVGTRFCDVYGAIRGQHSELWRPVIRRSILDGDGNREGVTMIGADVTTTLISCPFGTFVEPQETHQR